MSNQIVPVLNQNIDAVPLVSIIFSRQSTSSFTCTVAFFPLQGNMQTSVDRPALLERWMEFGASISMAPQLWQALTIEWQQPCWQRQVKLLNCPQRSTTLAAWESPKQIKRTTAGYVNRIINVYLQKSSEKQYMPKKGNFN